MKDLLILGTGCPKCQKLADHTREAAEALGLEFQITKVTDLNQIAGFGVMMTPALVVDGAVRVSGRVPDVEALKKLLA